MKVSAIILAGGKSSRMGENKAHKVLGGKSLLEIAIKKLLPISSEILISSNDDLTVANEFRIVPDEIRDIGPLGGIYSCLKASENEINIVLSVDSPFVPAELFLDFLQFTDEYLVVLPCVNKKIHPLIGVYNKNILPLLKREIDEKHYKMISAVKKSKLKMIEIIQGSRFNDTHNFFNINSYDDFLEAKKLYEKMPKKE